MLQVGQKIGKDDNGRPKYEVDELYGQGGHAVVFRGHRISTGDEEFAIKAIRPEYGHDGAFVKRFRREQEQMREHRQHPNLSPAVDWDRLSDGTQWLAMRWIDGDSLDALVEREGFLPAIEAAELIAQAADGLAAAHGPPTNVAHLDLHPGNLMVERGMAIVIDFGLAKRYDHTSGSPLLPQPGPFNAPELIVGQRLTPKSDVYSLGLNLAYTLTGAIPIDGNAQFPTNIEVPRSLRRLIRKATAENPDARPDAATFAADLREAAGELRAGRRRRAVAIGWVAIACLLTAVATFFAVEDLGESTASAREVAVDGLELTVPAGWKQSTGPPAARNLGLGTALRSPSAVVLIGSVAPTTLPPARGERGTVAVRLDAGPALRSDRGNPLGAERAYFLRVGDRDLALFCIAKAGNGAAQARRLCDQLGSTVHTELPVSTISGPSPALRKQARTSLAAYAKARLRGTRRLAAAATPAAARRAAAQTARATTAAATQARSPSLSRLRTVLRKAAVAWQSAARAADRGREPAFESAGTRVAAADRAIRRARVQLRALGFR